jgi:hypothetical protein
MIICGSIDLLRHLEVILMKKLTEMNPDELLAYKQRWSKKLHGYKDGSKNYRKTWRRIRRANDQLRFRKASG